MKTLSKIAVIYTLLCIFVSCSSSEDNNPPTETQQPNTEEVSGNWIAEKAFFEVDFDGTIESADFIEEGGNINMAIQENGRFSIEFVLGEDTETISGQMTRTNSLLSIVFDYSPNTTSYFEIQNTDTTLLIDGGPLEYDFDNDGTAEPAVVSFRFIRN
ncbi:hypothetical protein [Flagellimonas aequoris]|uniref:Lipocalin-like domain-containing protein n=1 Tax=Flagellimonas aequoris TaxID=2306997 RepID=A0A418N5V5_9FLAO|nr:hypothetical protein [Allomuricauda aequoris]RIV69348.1 hypothetical protein D2U88_13170 [Allomuricauda aequoris]TXK01017.1 hypothetical protein FQ019_13045 [Allomuricauda aequoris]